jgi:hypothetical protein
MHNICQTARARPLKYLGFIGMPAAPAKAEISRLAI